MSWIKRRPLLCLGVFAFLVRASCAVLTEYKPIFPPYYYTDATLTHVASIKGLDAIRAGGRPAIAGALSERIQTLTTMGVYRVFGARPLAIKLVNALLGALAVAALTWTMTLAFPLPAAAAAGGFVALWPSHVFYTSQNLKEAPVDLLAYAALGGALAAGLGAARTRPRATALALGAGLALLGVGFYRSSVMLLLAAALMFAFFRAAKAPAARMNAAGMTAILALVLAAYPAATRSALLAFDPPELQKADASAYHLAQLRLIPKINDEADSSVVHRPTSPEGLSRLRRARQAADRRWAKFQSGDNREIGTQIHPDAEFKTWGDVLLYLPKGAFSVLFMPLPGLYPMDGKIGRWAAGAENLLLLAVSALALCGFVRGPKTPARLCLFAFFAAMAAGAALLEYDLGSAGRHKLLYLPMLFPFASEEALRLLAHKESA